MWGCKKYVGMYDSLFIGDVNNMWGCKKYVGMKKICGVVKNLWGCKKYVGM